MNIAKYLLTPILLAQEKRLRSKVVKLAPPQGPNKGVHGEGPSVRLLLLGDSTAKSVGVETMNQTLISQLLASLDGHQVHWQVEGTTGHDSQNALKALKSLEPRKYDIVMTTLGVNDVTGDIDLKKWLEVQQQIRHYASTHLNAQVMIVSGILPIWRFPALPQPLKWYLSNRAKAFDNALRRDLVNESKAHYLNLEFSMDLHDLAHDGYHPGPKIYQEWAKRSSAIIHKHL